MKKNITFKNIVLVILLWFGILVLNNIINIKHIIFDGNFSFDFLTFEIIFSMLISLFYVFVVRKKNKYVDIAFYVLLFFFNLLNDIPMAGNINTFFLLYVFIITFAFVLFKKINNFSFSLITAFSLMLLITLVLGMFDLLITVKYLLPLAFAGCLIYIYIDRDKYSKLTDKFFNKELIIFTILFIIAILGGVQRYVHVYDEYSHWAYDAKMTIYYDKFGASPDVMSKTRGYAPIITSWHYIVAQYAGFSEPNLYSGLAIFCVIYIMALFCNVYKKNNFLLFLSGIVAYSCIFYFGDVYSYSNLYADLAFACTFAALLIYYFYRKNDDKISLIPLFILLPVVTLIKPSGCIVIAAFLVMVFIDYAFQGKFKISNLGKIIVNFIKKYWKIIFIIAAAYLFWNIYIKIINHLGKEFYDYTVMPWTLMSSMSYKLNVDFILGFMNSTFKSFDSSFLYSVINISYFKFLIIIFTGLYFGIYFYNKKDTKKTNKNIMSLVISYILFFAGTMLSVFMMLSYYEASILASVGRYIDVMNIAMVYLLIFLFINKDFIISKKREFASIIILIVMIFGLSFSQISYFATDIKDRISTWKIKDEHIKKFKTVINNTKETDNVYVIDQNDTDGIMTMWYARYYLFPRKVNASSGAISWKIRTDKNKDDLQTWGMTAKDLEKCLINYKFDYLYLYSADDEFFKVTSDFYSDEDDAKKYKLFKIQQNGNSVMLIPVA